MKKTLLIAALTMMSTSAFASKARLAALASSRTVATDIQYIFEGPQKMWELGDQVTFETGLAGTTYNSTTGAATVNSPNAEGGFLRTSGSSKYGAYVGHQSAGLNYLMDGGTIAQSTAMNAGGKRMENPINLFYGMKLGDMNIGANVYYASSQNSHPQAVSRNQKSASGVAFGASADKWNASLVVGLKGESESSKVSIGLKDYYKAGMNTKLAAEFSVRDDLVAFGSVASLAGKHTTAAAATEDADLETTQLEIGAESKIKADGVHFFYGASLQNTTEKNKVTGAAIEKLESMTVPVFFGAEVDAASWLVVRASMSQDVITSNKLSASSTDAMKNVDTTKAGMGFGLKFGKLMIDGSMAGAGTGVLNGNNLLADVGATYVF